jgi:hypothetical protein
MSVVFAVIGAADAMYCGAMESAVALIFVALVAALQTPLNPGDALIPLPTKLK